MASLLKVTIIIQKIIKSKKKARFNTKKTIIINNMICKSKTKKQAMTRNDKSWLKINIFKHIKNKVKTVKRIKFNKMYISIIINKRKKYNILIKTFNLKRQLTIIK